LRRKLNIFRLEGEKFKILLVLGNEYFAQSHTVNLQFQYFKKNRRQE
jgi:hypothetical protein